MNNRRGFTLVEILIALSASSVLMVLAIGLVHRSMSANSLARKRADHQRTLLRLTDRFRDDVHRGEEADLFDTTRLQLHLTGGRSVDYVLDGSDCRREEVLDGGGKLVETFKLLSGSQISFDEVENPDRIVMRATRAATGKGGQPLVDAHTEAVVGRMLWLQNPQEPSP